MNLLTATEAAGHLSIHPETLRAYVRAGKVRAYKLGNRLRFSTVDLEYFVRQHATIKEEACCTEEKTLHIGGLKSRSVTKQYNDLLGLKTS